jgi:hypothetical protein
MMAILGGLINRFVRLKTLFSKRSRERHLTILLKKSISGMTPCLLGQLPNNKLPMTTCRLAGGPYFHLKTSKIVYGPQKQQGLH